MNTIKEIIRNVIAELNKSAEWEQEKTIHIGKVNIIDVSTIEIDFGVGMRDTEYCTVEIYEDLIWDFASDNLNGKSKSILKEVMTYSILPAVGENWDKIENEYEQIRIGRRIKEIREKRGMKQVELGKLIGLQRPNISRLESGKFATGLHILQKVATALNYNLDFVEKTTFAGNNRNEIEESEPSKQIIIQASDYNEVLLILNEKHNFDGCGKWKKTSRGFIYTSKLYHIRYNFEHDATFWNLTYDKELN